MGKKFLLSDLDGTLLDTPEGLSAKYVATLNQLIDEGLDFSIATGRDMVKAKEAIGALQTKWPVILTNGALLGDLTGMQYLEHTYIGGEIIQEILKIGEEYGIVPIVFAAFDKKAGTMHFNKGKWGRKGIRSLTEQEYRPLVGFDVVSIQFHAAKDRLDPFHKNLLKRFGSDINLIYIEDVSYSQWNIEGRWFWLEINSNEAGKEKMLERLVRRLHREMKDVIVFGDNINDIEMLKAAGLGIAVANAPDEVKKAAQIIVPSNREGGVIHYILEHKGELI
jgi:hypothetical protein